VPALSGLAVIALQSALLADGTLRITRRHRGAGDAVAFAVAAQTVALAQICAIILALGYAGVLSSATIVGAHSALWLATRLALRATRPAQRPYLPARVQPRHVLAAVLAMALLLVALTGVLSETLIHDSLSYRLSRIGYWLQEGSVRHFPTNEPRQTFSPINVDLVMLWLTHPFARGFPLVTLAQAWGGLLLLLSTWGAASSLGLSWRARLGAALMALAMPCVFVQLMTSHNDLLTAGLLASAAYLWLEGRTTGRWVWPTALALALALGAKGTVLYMAPAASLVVLAATVAGRPAPGHTRRLATALMVSLVFFAAPRYVENFVACGDPFGPPEMYALNHGSTALPSLPEKTSLNLASYAVQSLHPASNPAVLAPLLSRLFRWSVAHLPESDPFSALAYPRRPTLAALDGDPRRNADTVSTGVLVPLLALLGSGAAVGAWMRGGPSPARWVVAGSSCVAGFLVCFSALFLWWPSSFRFFSLTAPFVAVPAAWGLERLSVRTRRPAWILVAALCLSASTEVYFGTVNAGFQAVPPVRVPWSFYGDLLAERAVVSRMEPGLTLGVAVPENTVLAGFFRGGNDVRVRFLTPEALGTSGSAIEIMRENRLDALVVRPPGLPGGGAPAATIGNPSAPRFVLYLYTRPDAADSGAQAPGDPWAIG
jgi:hypothetical protein